MKCLHCASTVLGPLRVQIELSPQLSSWHCDRSYLTDGIASQLGVRLQAPRTATGWGGLAVRARLVERPPVH